MKKNLLSLLLSLLFVGSYAQDNRLELKLYPDAAGGDTGLPVVENRDDNRISGGYEPSLTVFFPEGKSNGQAVVICPGGGYAYLAAGHEGYKVAEWLNGQGVTGIVLKYRMPAGKHQIPLKDALTAVEMVRANAEEWGIDPAMIGVMGFSAGGHLASTAATHFTSEADRPDFAVLIYPVITMGDLTHMGSRNNLLGEEPDNSLIDAYSNEKHISPGTPPVFIAFSDDDRAVDPRNGTMFYNKAKEAGVPAELHIYPAGGHGWGVNESFLYRDEFMSSLSRWLSSFREKSN